MNFVETKVCYKLYISSSLFEIISAILAEIVAVKGEIEAYKAKEKKAYSKMFQ